MVFRCCKSASKITKMYNIFVWLSCKEDCKKETKIWRANERENKMGFRISKYSTFDAEEYSKKITSFRGVSFFFCCFFFKCEFSKIIV